MSEDGPSLVCLALERDLYALPVGAYAERLAVAEQALLVCPREEWGHLDWGRCAEGDAWWVYRSLDASSPEDAVSTIVSTLAGLDSRHWGSRFEPLFDEGCQAAERLWLLGEIERMLREQLSLPASDRRQVFGLRLAILCDKATEDALFGPITLTGGTCLLDADAYLRAVRSVAGLAEDHPLSGSPEDAGLEAHSEPDWEGLSPSLPGTGSAGSPLSSLLSAWARRMMGRAPCGLSEDALCSELCALALAVPHVGAQGIEDALRARHPLPDRVEEIDDRQLRAYVEHRRRDELGKMLREACYYSGGDDKEALSALLAEEEVEELRDARIFMRAVGEPHDQDEMAREQALVRPQRLALMQVAFRGGAKRMGEVHPFVEAPLWDRLVEGSDLTASAWLRRVPWLCNAPEPVQERQMGVFLAHLLGHLPEGEMPPIAHRVLRRMALCLVQGRHGRRVRPGRDEALDEEVGHAHSWLLAALPGWRDEGVEPGWLMLAHCALGSGTQG